MRFLPFCLLFAVTLFGSPKDLSSFNSKFVQTIIDDNNKKIVYHGELWASKPQNALWVYQKPIQKSVYINSKQITVIEPLIEQATLRRLGDEIDFLSIIKKAKPVDSSHYTATVNGQTYIVEFKNDLLTSISYKDSFDNRIVISFTNPVQNQAIDPTRFKATIPADYDILRD